MTTGITHFTSQAAAAAILDGWCMDLTRSNSPKNGSREIQVRLYSRWGTNDPREPRTAESGTDLTLRKHPKSGPAQSRMTFPDEVFMCCGSTPQRGDEGETTDRLEMWRAYGEKRTWSSIDNLVECQRT